jgi:ferredoxin--NADP+ reductase
MLATGTGLAPFRSMLRSGACFERHDHVVIVHGVRSLGHLAYADELREHVPSGKVTYVPVVSRERGEGVLAGRVTTALVDGSLEAAVGRLLTPDDAHALLCGNPDMIDEMEARLVERGFTLHTPSTHGRLHLERYW